jgi:hypothetical protein
VVPVVVGGATTVVTAVSCNGVGDTTLALWAAVAHPLRRAAKKLTAR